MDIGSIYKRLPRTMQNIGLSAYGLKQYRLRYGQQLPEPYSRTDLHDGFSAQEAYALQSKRFRLLVDHAAQYVPYYSDLFSSLGIPASEISLENFRDIIPVLTKAEVVATPERFHSTFFRDKAIKLFTSGTSGSPMPILCTYEARAINYAFYRSLLLKHGCDVRDRSATFAGRVLLRENERSVFVRKDYFNKTLYLSSYHITDETISSYIQSLEQWQPRFIDSYPSAISLIADYINRHAIKPKLKLEFILTSSETLTNAQRESIQSAFSCSVLDHYGCSEAAVSASSDAPGIYRVDSLYSLVEFHPNASARDFSIVCTGLLNFAMPLLRYSIGDVVHDAQVSAESPFCGQQFAHIIGREDDIIITPEGRKIGRMDPAFKGVEGISQAQIVQRSIDQLDVLVVPLNSNDAGSMSAILIKNIQERTSPFMQVNIQLVDSIPLTKSGKFKSVVSKLPKADR